MKTKRNTHIITGIILIAAAAALLFTIRLYYVRHIEESSLYLTVSPYRAGETDWETSQDLSFPKDSAEEIFLQGMDAFASEDYDTAKGLFEKALDAPDSDPALPAYLYYYINECSYMTNGVGDYDTISLALDAAGQYAPLANDRNMLWDLVSTIALNPETDSDAIALMQDYLQKTENLNPAAWARLKNCIAMLEYNNEEYAKSIRNFYDVELELENVKMTPEIHEELRYAKEYIANIYYIFEDYEKTVMLYQEIIDSETESDPALSGYSYYINQSTAYLELSDLDNARKTILALKDILPHLDDSAALEVEASMNDVLANICMEEGNYAEAETYISSAETFFREHQSQIFYGSKYFTMISRCEYMIHEGNLQDAQKILEDMITEGDAAYYGLEEDVYELLMDIYRQTGQNEKLIEAYEHMLEFDRQFSQTTQREYLEFSEYYRDAKKLEQQNANLSRVNTFAVLAILIISIVLIVVLVLIRFLRRKNVTDQLTGIYNRKKLNQLMGRYKRTGTPANLGVVMMDIDFFKRYNDTYGHPAGDEVLKEVAKVLTESVRKNDFVIRYGGEEFLLLLNGVQFSTAEAVCQRIHKRLADRGIPHAASEVSSNVTLSMGLCHQNISNSASFEKLIEYADECLYQSKENGRNRVTSKELQ